MSIDLYVVFKKSLTPTKIKLNSVLKFRGFEWKIIAKRELDTQAGFMPVMHKGKKTGFEFDISKLDPDIVQYFPNAIKLNDRDAQANIRFTREDELAAAMPGALAFALLTQGIFYDPQEDKWVIDPGELNDMLDTYCKRQDQ